MSVGGCCLCVCTCWIVLVVPSSSIRECLDGVMINVILLNDDESPWSLKFVEREIVKAIEMDSDINAANGKERNHISECSMRGVHCDSDVTVLLPISLSSTAMSFL